MLAHMSLKCPRRSLPALVAILRVYPGRVVRSELGALLDELRYRVGGLVLLALAGDGRFAIVFLSAVIAEIRMVAARYFDFAFIF